MNALDRVDARATLPHDGDMADIAYMEVPAITLGWRLRISLDRAGIKAEEMAHELGVHRGTVSRWMHDETPPRTIYLREWARITRVPFEWLAGDAAADTGEEQRRDIHENRPGGLLFAAA